MNPFETETMADLCVRQGHRDEAVAIYRRLLARATDAPTRGRLGARLRELAPEQLAGPGLLTHIDGDTLSIEWRLPAEVPRPRTMELLLVVRTTSGVATEPRSIALDSTSDAGHLELRVPGLHSARAAVGHRRDNRFIPALRA